MPHVIVLDNIADEGLQRLQHAEAAGVTFEVRTGLKGDDLKEALLTADAAVCRSGVTITADVLEGNRRLKAIARAGVGTDNIDKDAATQAGIVVMNTPDGNTISTAELAFTLMLALSRNIPSANQKLLEGKWDKKGHTGAQLAGKTLGIIGLGRIGTEFAMRAKAFQMRVMAYDPFLSDERAESLKVEKVAEIKDLLRQVDYLTVHTPKTPETTNLVNLDNLDSLKPGIRLINAARGGIYNEDALVEGLKTGKIGGVALDVFDDEPCTDSPLFSLGDDLQKRVVCTPHLGASTEEAQTLVAEEAVDLVIRFLTTGEIRHPVNAPPLDPETLRTMRGELNTAYRLGRLLAQWTEGEPFSCASCTLHYRGEIVSKDVSLLTSAFCTGFGENCFTDPVNIINAQKLFEQKGIRIVPHTHPDAAVFHSSITAVVEGGNKSFAAGGALFGNNMPRLIRLHNYELESFLDGMLVIFTHTDVPGIIGKIGTTFGQHDINIAHMTVGRPFGAAARVGEAIGVLQVDERPPADVLQSVLEHEGVKSAQVIELPARDEFPSWLK